MSRAALIVLLLLLSGCASYGVVENRPIGDAMETSYSVYSHARRQEPDQDEVAVLLAFSGGGTRAAAFSYGVLQALRETTVRINGRERPLLDEVNFISSVSGGSFTSAYYGLYGDRIFQTYEQDVLNRNIQGGLLRRLYNPLNLFGRKARTEVAVSYFDQEIFNKATFREMSNNDGPIIVINASDLGDGVRFSFTQEYFNLLCSDLSSFRVSRAVAASSAVPVVFSPIVIRNYPGCMQRKPDWLAAAQKRLADDAELSLVTKGLETFLDKNSRHYIHLVDGGISDNLGLRAIYEMVEIAGGPRAFMQHIGRRPSRRIVVISVDASTSKVPEMNRSNREPSLEETVDAMTDIQLHRYNAATLELFENATQRWARALSTPRRKITPYFIQLGFSNLENPEQRRYINQIPTNFSLDKAQVEALIEAGRSLLRNNPDFRRLLRDLGR